ncbi:MAG: FAD-binding oxidoreductase [Candidatus Pacearchaeota archaeon]|jgi:hypothetical protein
MEYKVKIINIESVTHDTKKFILEKPLEYTFTPGQATNLSINKPIWMDQTRPFTFTSLNSETNLELIIKTYPEHHGVTKKLFELVPGDELFISDPWGYMQYKGEGIFIAGGTGLTPFLAIFRELNKNNNLNENKLIFSNKTKNDILLETELKNLFKNNLILTLTKEKSPNYLNERINESFLKNHIKDFSIYFYICGPQEFTDEIKDTLIKLGANPEKIIT